ncbi:MAG: hypothetical protein GX078_07290 [Clostridiales bacterium]|nr:hypothetical protein [Clostridiales bacterium]
MYLIIVLIALVSIITINLIIKVVYKKDKDSNEPGKIFQWFYSDKHPQRKFYKNLYRETEKERKDRETEQRRKDAEIEKEKNRQE